MTTEKASLEGKASKDAAKRSDTVLEKLKRYADDLEDLNKIEGFGTERSEWEDVRAHHRCNFEIYTLPKIIAALELVEERAKKRISSDNEDFEVIDYSGSNINDAYDLGSGHGQTDFARDLLAVVNGETKGE